MNKIEKLIDELCPHGVEFRALGEVAKLINGRAYKRNELLADGPTPVLRVGNFFSNREWYYSDLNLPEDKYCHRGDLLYAWSASFGPRIWEGEKAIFHYHIWKIEISNKIDKTFLYYLLGNDTENIKANGGRGATMVHLTKGDMEKRKIPIPPLSIQKEIVKILDNFTQLEAELEAELEARKKQYEHYRDELLSFGDDVEFRALGEVCVLKAGKSISAYDISNSKNRETCCPCIGGNGLRGYVRSFSHDGGFPVIGRQGALCGNIYFAKGKFYATEHAVVVSNGDRFISRFMYHLLTVMNLNQYATGGAQPGLAVSKLNKIKIPIPPLSKQKQIVAILDKFDALVNDISTGLPAEIAARKKQYEYYRNQLLTFKCMGDH